MPPTQAHEFAAGIRSDGVRNATGRDWQGWFTLLDQAGVDGLPRQESARDLHDQLGLSGWWSRMVTEGYEQARGMRPQRVRPVAYTASRSRTIHVPVARLYRAWSSERERVRWLPGYPVLIRKATPERAMRITWTDGVSGVNVFFVEKGRGVSQVRVQHVNLADERAQEAQRTFWRAALEQLRHYLEDGDESATDLQSRQSPVKVKIGSPIARPHNRP